VAFKVGLLGLGTVGTATAEILLNPEQRHPILQEIAIKKVGVRSPDKPRQVQLPRETITTDLEKIVNDPEIDIVVELLGGLEPARSLILKAIEAGKHVVTANKAVIARYGDQIYNAAAKAKVYVLLEGAVGGGIPVIEPLKQSLGANKINRVIGIVNGTTNYILSQMAAVGADFKDVLAEAQKLGYAEADPTADVDGLDAADKITILTSLAFAKGIKREEVLTEGIRQVSITDINYAEKLGFAIKLLAISQSFSSTNSDRLLVRVHPTLVPKNHPLASVNGVNNAISIEGDPIGQVMFFGPGAGGGATASAVVADIMNIVGVLKSSGKTETLDPLLSSSHQEYATVVPNEELVTRFYARSLARDVPGVIGQLGTCFGKYNVSLESVVQIGFVGEFSEIVVVTHDVKEGNFRLAIEEISNLDAIETIPSILRVL